MSLLHPAERMALTIAKRHIKDYGNLANVGDNTVAMLVAALDRIDQETDEMDKERQ